MKSNSKKYSVSSVLKKIRNGTMDLDPQYQRGAVWGRSRKALLIDSMLRGYDLPKIYLRETSRELETFEVVDGVQRLTSMDDFVNNEVPLPKGSEWSGLRYWELPEHIQERLDDYQLDFAVLEDCSDEEVREMFHRLQGGMRLNTAEELNAVSGDMNAFVEALSNSAFFEKTACFTKSRGASRHVAAQIAKLCIAGRGDVRKSDLMKFYTDHKEWKVSSKASTLKTSLNWMHATFGENHALFRNRAQTVSVAFLTYRLWTSYALKEHGERYRAVLEEFDQLVVHGASEVKDYATAMSHSSDQGVSVDLRDEYLQKAVTEFLNEIPAKDKLRQFDVSDRVVAWYRAGGVCEEDGCTREVGFSEFHADHAKAWSKGGRTSKDNLRVLCPKHNLSKGAK